jgi:hypothetical protein
MEPPSSGSATAVSQMTDLFDNGLGYTVDGMNANLQLSLRFKPKESGRRQDVRDQK